MWLLDSIIRWSIVHRLFVVAGALGITVYGVIATLDMPVDVFPDLTAPTVTVLTEAHGLAPEEVEALVTFPVEAAVNGATGVRRVRSSSGIGISVVWVEFDWGTDIYQARQIVNEKLQLVTSQIPPDIGPPLLAPISSIMGEILFIGVKSKTHTPLELRSAADWVIRKRLLALSGVAQVIPIGGGVRQFQVLVDPSRLEALDVTFAEVVEAVRESNQNSSGGFVLKNDQQESLIRGVGRIRSQEDLARTVVVVRDGVPVVLSQVADVVVDAAIKRGEGSSQGEPAVVLGVLKQPGSNTLELTQRVDASLDDIQRTLPQGMTIDRDLFRQSDFIETAVDNVAIALRDGAILVAVILFLFLLNVRATLISLAALPVSLIVATLAMETMGITINTMTLGGLTIAIGALVDDAIIDVENVVRRLRENRGLPAQSQRAAFEVIFDASREVRGSIVFATLIVMLVFVPLFFLSGVEGRLLYPLGFAYLVAIFASLVVALTLTPAMCAYLLPLGRLGEHDSVVIRALKRVYRPLLRGALRQPWIVIGAAAALLAGTLAITPFLGRTFLPEFNEGALTISAVTLPGTSLAQSDRMGRRIEQILLTFPEVASTARRTGRAELDEHAQDVNAAEIDVRLVMGEERSKEELLAEIRTALSVVSGMVITIGQPISHRIDHMLSGTRANIAIKLFGDELHLLRTSAEAIRKTMAGVEGVVDLSVEQQVDIPQLVIDFDRDAIARYGFRSGALAELVEQLYAGIEVTQVLEQQRTYDVLVRYEDSQRADLEAIRSTIVDTPTGQRVPLKMLARIREDIGPNTISRENVQRKIVVMANVSGRDLRGVVDDIRRRVEERVTLPQGYYVVYGGQFESEQEATRTITLLGGVVIAGIFLLLFLAFQSARSALLIMVNLPLALIGGVFAVYLGGGVLSVASLVGFITLFGIATRNGIMMISHFEHLVRVEGASFDEAIERGSMERLAPILMTALCAGLALIPLVLAGDEPGNEIQAPMGIVILGGLLSSTALNMIVVPALYHRFARRSPRLPTDVQATSVRMP